MMNTCIEVYVLCCTVYEFICECFNVGVVEKQLFENWNLDA